MQVPTYDCAVISSDFSTNKLKRGDAYDCIRQVKACKPVTEKIKQSEVLRMKGTLKRVMSGVLSVITIAMIQLVVMFFTWLSATVFHILSGIICITAVLGYGFGQETGTEAVRMLVAGFILYILPVLSGWAVVWLETIKIRLMK